jgi:tetratricopeptide (TPR) repeat protein
VNEARGRGLEFEEILGFHLEQAYRYVAELGPVDEHGRAVGADGSRRLANAGRRAFGRGDMHAAANLLDRAAQLLPDLDPDRLWLLPDLGEALLELGEFDRARSVVDEAASAASEVFDGRLGAHAGLIRLLVEVYSGADDGWSMRVLEAVERAVPVFEAAADHQGLARAWRLRFGVSSDLCRFGDAAIAAEHVLEEARLAGDRRLEARGVGGFAMTALHGPAPVPDATAACESLLAALRGDLRTEGLLLGVLAELYAMAGSFERARDAYRQGRLTLERLGQSVLAASTSANSWRVEVLAGDPEAAEGELRRDYAALERMGETHVLPTIAASLAHVRLALGDEGEAESLARKSQALAASDDVEAQAFWRGAVAIVLARSGEADAAEELAMQALALVRPTEAPIMISDALIDAAEVFKLIGRAQDGRQLLEEAVAVLDAKGDVVTAARLRAGRSSVAREEMAPTHDHGEALSPIS